MVSYHTGFGPAVAIFTSFQGSLVVVLVTEGGFISANRQFAELWLPGRCRYRRQGSVGAGYPGRGIS